MKLVSHNSSFKSGAWCRIGLVSVVGCLGLVACSSSSHIPSDESWDRFRLAMAMTEKAPVVPPDYNPYSTVSADAAKAYIDQYYEGYRIGLAGYYLTPMLKEGPYQSARKDGYEAGIRAGLQQSKTTNCAPGLYKVK